MRNRQNSGDTAREMAGAPLTDNAAAVAEPIAEQPVSVETAADAIADAVEGTEDGAEPEHAETLEPAGPKRGGRFAAIFSGVKFAAVAKPVPGKPFGEGRLKGTVQTRLADAIVDIAGTGMQIQCAVVTRLHADNKRDYKFNWPSTGSGPFARQVLDCRNDAAAAMDLDDLTASFLDQWKEYQMARVARGEHVAPAAAPTSAFGVTVVNEEQSKALGF